MRKVHIEPDGFLLGSLPGEIDPGQLAIRDQSSKRVFSSNLNNSTSNGVGHERSQGFYQQTSVLVVGARGSSVCLVAKFDRAKLDPGTLWRSSIRILDGALSLKLFAAILPSVLKHRVRSIVTL